MRKRTETLKYLFLLFPYITHFLYFELYTVLSTRYDLAIELLLCASFLHLLLSFAFAALYLFAVIPFCLWFPRIYFRKAKSQKNVWSNWQRCFLYIHELCLLAWSCDGRLCLTLCLFFFHRWRLMKCTVHEDNLNMSFCDCFCGPPYCCALLNEGKNRGEN